MAKKKTKEEELMSKELPEPTPEEIMLKAQQPEISKQKEKEAQKLFLAGETEKTSRVQAGQAVRAQAAIAPGRFLPPTSAQAATKQKQAREQLEQRHLQEREGIFENNLNNVPLEQRKAVAGITALQQLVKKGTDIFGIENNPRDAQEVVEGDAIARGVGQAIGEIGNINVPVIGKLFNVFSNAGATLDNLQKSSKKTRQASTTALRNVKNGGDLSSAISQLSAQEAAIRDNYATAVLLLRQDPKDIAEGLDLTDDMQYDLDFVITRRQELERAALTGDLSTINSLILSAELEEQQLV